MDINTKEALEHYYKLKSDYQDKIAEKRKKIRNDKTLSKREKHKEMLKFVPRCINCGKKGGTSFSVNGTTLRSVCGNTEEPCQLNIEINRGLFTNISETYNLFMDDKEDIKEDIIRARLDLLFNYVSEEETIIRFEELTEQHKTIEQGIMDIEEMYQNIILSKRNKVEINEAKENLNNFKEELSDLAKQYSESGDEMLINNMVENYIGKIRPEAEKLREYQYSQSSIECSNGDEYMGGCDDDLRLLIQKPYMESEAESSPSEEPVVIANTK